MRKHLLEYDDVMNKQREAVYRLRRDVLEGKEGRDWVLRGARAIVVSLVDSYCPEDKHPDEWDQEALEREFKDLFGLTARPGRRVAGRRSTGRSSRRRLTAAVEQRFEERERTIGADQFRQLERYLILSVLDAQWKDHLLALDHLKEGIGMRAYGQRDPLVEYKRESFDLFQEMMERVEDQVVQYLYRVELVQQAPERRHRQVGPPRAEGRGLGSGGRTQGGAALAGLDDADDRAPLDAQGGAERPLSVRLRQEVQEVPRRRRRHRPPRKPALPSSAKNQSRRRLPAVEMCKVGGQALRLDIKEWKYERGKFGGPSCVACKVGA